MFNDHNNRTEDLKETEARITAVLENIHQIRSLRYSRSDYTASNVLIDYLNAYESANLTDKQKEALNYVYERDLTQKEASDKMGCTQQSVQQHIKAAIKKIAEKYKGKDRKEGINNVK